MQQFIFYFIFICIIVGATIPLTLLFEHIFFRTRNKSDAEYNKELETTIQNLRNTITGMGINESKIKKSINALQNENNNYRKLIEEISNSFERLQNEHRKTLEQLKSNNTELEETRKKLEVLYSGIKAISGEIGRGLDELENILQK